MGRTKHREPDTLTGSRMFLDVYDGFTSFECKKDLYQLKDIIDRALAEAPDFGEMEQQWLTEQEQKRIIKILKS